MKKKLLSKCFITLGLLLFFTVLIPSFNDNTVKAQSTNTEKDKGGNYKLNVRNLILAKGKSFALKTYNIGDAKVSFKSDDQEIASVNDDGVIFANKVGDTTITVIIKEGTDSTNLSCDVSVCPAAISVNITQSRIILGIDNTETLKIILKPINAREDPVFSSEKKQEIVSLSPGGRITAKNYGLTYIFAQIDKTDADGNVQYDTCSVIVTSSDNASKLETYFEKNADRLKDVSDADLEKALYDFFNNENTPDKAESTSLVSNLDRYLTEVLKLK